MSNINEREFLAELDDLANWLRTEIESKARGQDPAPEAVRARRRKVLHDQDFRFFAYTYFPHHIYGDPSIFQAEFCRDFAELVRSPLPCREWWVAPRGECKSSLLTKIGVVYAHVLALLQDSAVQAEVETEAPEVFVDYVTMLGAETRFPTKLMEVGKVELTSNPALALDFPEVCGRTDVWKVGEYIGRTGVKVEPFGAEQAIRGTFHGSSRPKWLLGDDLITDKEAKSPTERDNRWNWLEKAIDYLGPPDGSVKFFGVGTILNSDDPISRAKTTIGHRVHHYKAIVEMPTNTDLWERCEELMRNDDNHASSGAVEKLPSFKYYKKHQAAMDRGAVTSWPEVRSLYWLMRQRAKNRRAFGTEMQGEARNDEDQVFDIDALRFWVNTKRHWVWYGGCDPSLGKGKTSDPSALIVGAWCTEIHQLHIEIASSKRRIPTKLQADLISAQREYPIVLWGFENNGAFEHSRQTFIAEALRQEVTLPLHGITATAQTGAEVWIDSLEPIINGGRIHLKSGLLLLLEQLREWPNPQSHHHYDLLVALYLCWVIAAAGAGGLPKIRTPGRRIASQRTYRGYD